MGADGSIENLGADSVAEGEAAMCWVRDLSNSVSSHGLFIWEPLPITANIVEPAPLLPYICPTLVTLGDSRSKKRAMPQNGCTLCGLRDSDQVRLRLGA